MSYLGTNKIGKMYLGSTAIGKAYLGSNLVYQQGGGPAVMIPYIRGGADGSYIDTGIAPDSTTRVIVWARNFNPMGEFLFGSRDSANTQRFAVLHPGGNMVDRIRVDFGSNNQTYVDAATTRCSSGYHKYELNGNQFYIDDTLVATCPSATFSGAYSIHLFGYNDSGTHGGTPLYPIDICACQIYKSGVLVRDFTPANSPSVGLYDAVSQTLFTNAGGGSFAYRRFNQIAYTPLEYIECDGQYFDTTVYGTYSGKIILKFRLTNTTPKWGFLLGYRVSTNSCDISIGTEAYANIRCYWRFGPNQTSSNAYNSTSNPLTDRDVVAVKNDATLTLYNLNSQIGSASKSGVSASFQTEYPLAVGSVRTGEDTHTSGFTGRLYYCGLFGSGLSNLVPAQQGAHIGMYDTYNDVFYESESGTPFIAGPTL